MICWRQVCGLSLLLCGTWAAAEDQATYEQALEEFNNNPFAEDISRNVVWKADHIRPEKHAPADYRRCARQLLWLTHTNAVSENHIVWTWRDSSEQELPEAIDALLRMRLQVWEEHTSGHALMSLFRTRGAKKPVAKSELKALFGHMQGSLPARIHVQTAQLLEKGGFLENARREYARAAGLFLYFQNGFSRKDQALADKDLEIAYAGFVRLHLQLKRPVPELLAILQRLPAEDMQRLSVLIKTAQHQAPPKDDTVPWRRLAGAWWPDKQERERRILRIHPLGDDFIIITNLAVIRIRARDGQELWQWRPASGRLQLLNINDSSAKLLHDTTQDRQQQGLTVTLNAAPEHRLYKILSLDLGKGTVTSVEGQFQAEEAQAMSNAAVLLRDEHGFRSQGGAIPLAAMVPEAWRTRMRYHSSDGAWCFLGRYRRKQKPFLVALDSSGRHPPLALGMKEQLHALDVYSCTVNDVAIGVVGPYIWRSCLGKVVLHEQRGGRKRFSYVDEYFSIGSSGSNRFASVCGLVTIKGQEAVLVKYPRDGLVAVAVASQEVLWRRWLHPDAWGFSRGLWTTPIQRHPLTGTTELCWVAVDASLLAIDVHSGKTARSYHLRDVAEYTAGAGGVPVIGQHFAAVPLANRRVQCVRLGPRPQDVANTAEPDRPDRLQVLYESRDAKRYLRALIRSGGSEDPGFLPFCRKSLKAHGGPWPWLVVWLAQHDPEFDPSAVRARLQKADLDWQSLAYLKDQGCSDLLDGITAKQGLGPPSPTRSKQLQFQDGEPIRAAPKGKAPDADGF